MTTGIYMHDHYHPGLVVESWLIAVLAAYTTLELISRVNKSTQNMRLAWMIGGAIAMGLGVWSMHYLGMLAYVLPVEVQYDVPTVVLSLLVAIASMAMALIVICRPKLTNKQLVFGGTFIGGGIATMHYIGMSAMRLPATAHWNRWIAAASVLLAIGIALVAVALASKLRNEDRLGWKKFLAATVLGLVVPIMHYTAMAAVHFTPSPMYGSLDFSIRLSTLGVIAISLVPCFVLVLATVTALVDRHADQLRYVAAHYRSLFENAIDGMFRFDRGGQLLDANPALATMLGYTGLNDLLRKNLAHILWARAHNSGIEESPEEIFWRQLDVKGEVREQEFRIEQANGTYLWAALSARAILDVQGGISHYEGSLRNVTTQRNVQRFHEEFLSIVSQELSDSHAPAHKATEAGPQEKTGKILASDQPLIEMAVRNAVQLSKLVSDLIDLEKLQNGQLVLKMKPCELDALIHEAEDIVAGMAEAAEVTIKVDAPQITISADPGRILQVFTHLLDNAIKLSPAGGTITITTHIASHHVIVRVSNQGLGIPPEELETIFAQHKVVSNNNQKAEAEGVGFAICRGIVQLHGGDIWVESALHYGSTFCMTLPSSMPEKSKEPAHVVPFPVKTGL